MTIDPIAKCRCGRLFTPMEWAELQKDPLATAFTPLRLCPCGLRAARIEPITLDDIKKSYKELLEQIGRDNDIPTGDLAGAWEEEEEL